VGSTPSTNADYRHAEFFIGANALLFFRAKKFTAGQNRHSRRGQQRILQKLPPCELGHEQSFI
jgi:hypothetical protein